MLALRYLISFNRVSAMWRTSAGYVRHARFGRGQESLAIWRAHVERQSFNQARVIPWKIPEQRLRLSGVHRPSKTFGGAAVVRLGTQQSCRKRSRL